MKKLAFVLPRYYKGIVGGAETLISKIALKVKDQGYQVEIFTTCAKDNRTWENEFNPGVEIIDGIKVSRFLVEKRNLDSWIPKQIAIHDGFKLTIDDQLEWISESVNSYDLYKEIILRKHEFDLFFFGPALFGISFWGAQLLPEKSILVPCLHDEPVAYLEIMKSLFTSVKACMFNCNTEQNLARHLYGDIVGADVGLGFESQALASKPYFDCGFPYLLYLGRKETGKNVQVLIDDFIWIKQNKIISEEYKLVICGGGEFADLNRKIALDSGHVIDLQNVSEQEKQSLLRYAEALVQPSLNESFSIVIMEAWLQETPVLVAADCAVTRDHTIESGGGLYYANKLELAECVKMLQDHNFRTSLANNGKKFVESQYNWETVLDRFDNLISGRSQISLS